MILELPEDQLCELVYKQLNNLFFVNLSEHNQLAAALPDTLKRCDTCFAGNPAKYFQRDGESYFNPYHSGQYAIFLYYLSNTVFKQGNNLLADRLYYLNKLLNACDLYHEIELPDIFILDHPVGSVMGRAQYGNYFAFSQNSTVGNNKGIFPRIGEHVTMLSGTKILGDCEIGDYVTLAANTYVKDTDIPAHSLVFGESPNLVIKENRVGIPAAAS